MKEQIKACQEALKSNPQDGEAFQKLADILTELHQWKYLVGLNESYPGLAKWDQLIASLQAGLSQTSDIQEQSYLLHCIGHILEVYLNMPDKAIQVYQKAVKVWPGRSESFDAARRIYLAHGRNDMVIKLFKREFEVTPSLRRRGDLLMELSKFIRSTGDAAAADQFEAKARGIFEELAREDSEEDASEGDAAQSSSDIDVDDKAEVAEEKAEVAEEKAEAVEEKAEVAEEKAEVAEERAEAVEEKTEVAEEKTEVAEEKAEVAEEIAEAVKEKAEAVEEKAEAVEEKEEAVEEEAEVAEEKAEAVEEKAEVAEEIAEVAEEKAEVAEEKAEAVEEKAESAEMGVETLFDLCEEIYRSADRGEKASIGGLAEKACDSVKSVADSEVLCEALREADACDVLSDVLLSLSERMSEESDKRLMLARRADVLDLDLDRRDEAVAEAEKLSEGDDRASLIAKAVLAGKDVGKLEALTGRMLDLLKKAKRTPQEVPLMSDLAHIYADRLGSLKDAEDQYKRIKLAEPKSVSMLAFYSRYYASNNDWQRVLSTLKSMKSAVAGSYRELKVSREIARISEEKLNNPSNAVNVWNQMLKEGAFVDVAREELIGLYKRTQKWQALLDIYKNDLEASADVQEQIAIHKKCIEIYDEHLHLDAMVIKAYQQILAIDPNNSEAVDALIGRYEASKRWNDLLKMLTQKAETADDKATAVAIYYRIANLWSGSLGNVAKSIDPLTKIVEIDPKERKALRQLHEFYEQRNSWSNLYDVLGKEADACEPSERVSLLKRRAEIGENNLHSAEKAIESWEAMSCCLEDPREALEELVRLYGKQNNYTALLSAYERLIDHAHSDAERVEHLENVAHLYIDHLEDRAKGIEVLHKMLDIEEGRDNALSLLTELHVKASEWDELLKLYIDLGRADQLYELFDLTASTLDDRATQIYLYERMADVALDTLNDEDKGIAAYEKILEADARNEKTARRLLEFYTSRGEHRKAIKALEIILGWTEDADAKIDKLVQIADLYEQELMELDHAAEWYAKAVALAPSRRELREKYEKLVSETEAYAGLYEVYSVLVSREDLDAETLVALHRQLASVCQKHLNKPEVAISSWEACLKADGADIEAIDALIELYTESGNWEALRTVIEKKLELTEDPDEIKSLSFRRATLLTSELDDVSEAERSYERVLDLDASNLDAIHGLKALYQQTSNWEKLADILDKEQDLITDGRLDVIFALAQVKRIYLEKMDDALTLYSSILEEEPEHESTLMTLEKLMRDGVEADRIAQILEPVYERNGNHENQCEALEIHLRALGDEEKVPVLWQIYDLRHDVLHDDAASFDVLKRLFGLTPDDERVWDDLNEIAQKGEGTDLWAQMSALYAGIAADDEADDEWRFEVLRRRALIVEEKLENGEEAIGLWERLHAHDNTQLEPIQHLEKLYKDSSAFEKLVKLYEFETDLSEFSDEERIAKQLEAAQIYEDLLDRYEDAIRIFRGILEIDSTQADALNALERLYNSHEMWNELASLYEDELGIYTEADQARALNIKLAEVSDAHLSDYDRAIECYRTIIDGNHDDVEAVSLADRLLKKLAGLEDVRDHREALCEMLEPIYSDKKELSSLIDVLRIKLRDSEDDYDKVELNRRMALILRDELSDDRGAFDAFREALKVDIANEGIREDFESLALKLEEPKAIIELYEARQKDVDDDMLKFALLKRCANIYEEKLEDAAHAISSYRAMLEIDDMDASALNALEKLYTDAQNWPELIKILRAKADISSGEEKVDLLRKMALLNSDCISDTKSAIENYREILDNNTDDMDAINSLEMLYTQTEDWEALAENYGIKLQLAEADDAKRTILREMAELQETKLKRNDEAIQLYIQILDIFPQDEESLDALIRLYQVEEAYDDLADTLRKKLELHRGEAQEDELEYRIGQVCEQKLEAVDQAIDYYKAILARNAEHAGAHEALRGLLEHEDHKLDAARVLEELYTRTENYERLAEILEIQLSEESDGYAQVELLKRIAEIHQDKLTNYEAAFHDVARIVMIDQGNDYIEQLENLSEILNNRSELVDVYKKVVSEVYDAELQVSFNNKIASLLQNDLDDEAQAETYYKAALEIQADDATALDALDGIYTGRNAWSELLTILSAKVDACSEPSGQLPILYRIAEIQETVCDAHEDAIATYQRILDIEPAAPEARSRLADIFEKQEMWPELSDLVRAEIADEADPEHLLALKFKLAVLQNEKLHEEYEAIQTLQEIVNADDRHEGAIQYLESMFEAGKQIGVIAEITEPIYRAHNEWNKLVHSLEVRVGAEEDEYAKLQILEEIALTWLENLNDSSKALETYGRMLLIQPSDQNIQQKVESLASKTGELKVWAGLYTKLLEEGRLEDGNDKRTITLSLARLLGERLEQHDRARELCKDLLKEEPDNLEAYEILEWSYALKHDARELLEIWLKKLEILDDPEARNSLLFKSATIQEDILRDEDAAIKSYMQMLENDQNAQHAPEALERLLRKKERFDELSEFYRQRADYASDNEARSEYLQKLGVVLARELHKTEEAVEVLGEALSNNPTSKASRRALESLLFSTAATDENRELRSTMAGMLEPLYSDDEWGKLVHVLDVLIEVADDDLTKVSLYIREAGMYEAHDAHPRRAFDTYAKAFMLAPDNASAREKLEALASELDNYRILADVYANAVDRADNDADKISIFERLAELSLDKLSDAPRAAECYEAILKLDESQMKAIRALEKLYSDAGDYEKNIVVLRKHVELESNAIDQKDLYYRIASISEESLKRLPDAVEAYRAILDLDAEDQLALDALERLYAQMSDWQELIQVYRRKIDAASEASDRVMLYVNIANVYREKLEDTENAIDCYVQARAEDPSNIEVLDELEGLYCDAGRDNDLLEILQAKVALWEAAGKGEARRETQLRMAELLIAKLDDCTQAIETLRAVLAEDAGNVRARELMNGLLAKDEYVSDVASVLMPLYKDSGEYSDYLRVAERLISVTSDDFEKRSIYLDAARVSDEKLGDADRAFGFVAPALKVNPSDDEIVELGAQIAEHQSAFQAWAQLCEETAVKCDDSDAVIRLSEIAAKLYEENVNDVDKAIAQHERILNIDEFNRNALECLHRLYRKTLSSDKLATVIQRRLDNGDQPVNALRFELVELKLESDPNLAFELLKEILFDEKDDAKALEALEKLLPNKKFALEIADILEPHYREHAQNDKLANLLRVKADLKEDKEESMALFKQLATLELDELHDEAGAFKTYCAALAKDPEDAEVRGAVEELAVKLEDWRGLADAYQTIIKSSNEREEKISLHAKRAKLLMDKVMNYDEAEAALAALLKLDPKNIDALHDIESVYEKTLNHEKLLETREQLLKLAKEDGERIGILYQCSEVALDRLGDKVRGRGYLEDILKIDGGQIKAIEPLLGIYKDAEMYREYADLLDKKIGCLEDDDAKFDTYLKIAETSRDMLQDHERAISAYRSALDMRYDRGVCDALEAIFASRKMYSELDALYALEIEKAAPGSARAALKVRRAENALQGLKKQTDAVSLLKEALADDPENAAAFDMLDEIYTTGKDHQALYDLVMSQKSSTKSPDKILSCNIRLAKIAADLGRPEDAISALNDVLKLQPRNLEALNSAIAIHVQQKDYDHALEKLKGKLECMNTDAEKAEVYCEVARTLETANWGKAQVRQSYETALKADPRCETALKALYDMAEADGDKRGQLDVLRRRADNETDEAAKLDALLKVADKAEEDDSCADIAASVLSVIYSAKKDDVDLCERLIKAYLRANDTDSARPLLDSMITTLSESKQTKRLPPFYCLKGRMLKQAGDMAGAREAFEAANAIDKNNIANNLELGILLYEDGKYEEAGKVMNTLLLHQMNIKDKELKLKIFYYLGMNRLKLNEPKRAKDMFTRALGVDPNHEPSKAALASIG